VSAGIEIRPFVESDLDAVVELSLRAWEPVFGSLHQVLGAARSPTPSTPSRYGVVTESVSG